MSRVAKYPVALLKGVEVTLGTTEVSVKGPLGTLKQAMLPFVSVEKDGDNLQVKAGEGDSANAMSAIKMPARSGEIRNRFMMLCTQPGKSR